MTLRHPHTSNFEGVQGFNFLFPAQQFSVPENGGGGDTGWSCLSDPWNAGKQHAERGSTTSSKQHSHKHSSETDLHEPACSKETEYSNDTQLSGVEMGY